MRSDLPRNRCASLRPSRAILLGVVGLVVGLCSTTLGQSTSNTSFWVGTTNEWNEVSNWEFDGAAATVLPQDHASSSNRNVLFRDDVDFPASITSVQLGSNVAGLGDFTVMAGSFTLETAGFEIDSLPLTLGQISGGASAVLTVNDSSATTGLMRFRDVNLLSGSDSLASNNRLVIAGAAVANRRNIQIAGNTAGNSGNQLIIEDAGSLTLLPNSPGSTSGNQHSMTIGSGAALDLSGGSSIVIDNTGATGSFQFTFTVDADGLLRADDSSFSTVGTNTTIRLTLQSGSSAQLLAGSEMSVGILDLDPTASLLVDGSTFQFAPTSQTNLLVLNLNGSMEVQNAASAEFLKSPNATATEFRLLSGASLLVDGAEFSSEGRLLQRQGATFEVSNAASVQLEQWEMAYQIGSSRFVAGSTQVAEGGTFRFETLGGLRARDDFSLPVSGVATWGLGGTQITSTQGRNEVTVRLESGTTLLLDGGNYHFVNESGDRNGHLWVNSSASLEGSGTIGRDSGSAGTTVHVNGGAVAPGNGEEPGLLAFQNELRVNAPSTLVFDIFAFDSFSQIRLPSLNHGGNQITIHVLLWEDDDIFDTDEFPLVQNLAEGESNAFASANISFDFSQSAPVLAALGLEWDTSDFLTTGVLKIKSLGELSPPNLTTLIPEPNSVTPNRAVVRGDINPNGVSNNVFFVFGTASTSDPATYPFTAAAAPADFSGVVTETTSAQLTGLQPATTYYYRIASTNSEGTFYGSELSFTTNANPKNMAEWRDFWFDTQDNEGDAANTSAPAGDGIANLLKAANTVDDPTVSAVMPGEFEINGANGEFIDFSYTRNRNLSGLSHFVEWSDTLAPDSWSTSGVTNLVNENISDDLNLRVERVPRGTGDRRFVRLRVRFDFTSESVSTTPVGVNRLIALGNSDTLVGVTMEAPAAFFGTLDDSPAIGEDTATLGFTSSDRLSWDEDEFAGSHYIKFASGELNGRHYMVVGNSANALIVDANGDDLSVAGQGDAVDLIPYWTLESLFPSGEQTTFGVSSGTLGFQRSSELLVPDLEGDGVNLQPQRKFFITGTGWREDTTGFPVADSVILPVDSYFIIRHPASVANTDFSVNGFVPVTANTYVLHTRVGGPQDNYVSLVRPLPVTLEESGFEQGFVSSANTLGFSRRDELLIYDNSTVTRNKVPARKFFRVGSNWIEDTAGFPNANQTVLPSGQSIVIRKYQTVDGTTVFSINNPNY